MDRLFEDFLTGIDAAETDEEAWAVLCRSVESLGFDNAFYLFWPHAAGDTPGEPIYLTNYDEDWMQYWQSEGHAEIDIPSRKSLATGYRPVIMDVGKYIENPDEGEDSRALHALWEAKENGGCGKFYSHKLIHGASELGGLGLSSSTMDSADFENIIGQHNATLSAMIHISHARLSASLVKLNDTNALADAPTLSGRQNDMLVALSKGLRYKQIAHLYGISENTVAYHMNELRQKFQCSTSREILSAAYRFDLLKKL